MAEPAFYRCKSCWRVWQRSEWKTRRNPPAICPHCGSADQEVDQAREDEYVRDVYGPIAKHVGQLIEKKTGGKQ
jgi:Zn finger protein HypA/HybF involved in hydrogenase expression